MKRSLAALIALLVVGMGPVPAANAAELVVGGSANQYGPGARGDDWVGWTQYVKPLNTAHIRMQDGTDHRTFRRRDDAHSFFGDFDPSADQVIFQEARGRRSDLHFYRIDTEAFGAVPSGINTDLWEWAPDISTSFILFGRNKFTKDSSPWKIMLYDRMAGTFKTLDSAPNRCGCIFTESVNDRFAAWTRCAARCNVFVYDTLDGSRTKIPNPDKQQYGAALSDDGKVYFVRSGDRCGANPQIRRVSIGSPVDAELVYDYPSGTNLVWALDLVDGVDGNDDLYFDQASCSDARYRGDVYVIRDVDFAPAVVGRAGSASSRRPPRVAPPASRPLG